MAKFKLTRMVVAYECAYVEAESKEAATMLYDLDIGWKWDDSGETELISVDEVNP